MAKVFITYRRSDSGALIGRLYDRLVARYGRRNVYKDVDNIPPGVDFVDHIRASLKQCVVQLVIIGPKWTEVRTPEGNPRLADPTDLVRVEIETGLSLGLTVIPVLLGGGQMPPASELPESLHTLVQLNALTARDDPDFSNDLRRITAAIDRAFATRVVAGGGGMLQLLRWRAWILRRQLLAIGAAMLVVALFAVQLASAAQASNPAVVARLVKATDTAVAARTAAASATTAEQTAVVAAAQATQTTIAQATATAVYFLPYTAEVPGAPCDTNGAQWTVTTEDQGQTLTSVSCDGQQFTMTSHGAYTTNSEAFFQWPNHPLSDRLTVKVAIAIHSPETTAGIEILDPSLHGYMIGINNFGNWWVSVVRHLALAGPTSDSTELARGSVTLASQNVLAVTVTESSIMISLDAVPLTTVPRVSPSFALTGGGITLFASGSVRNPGPGFDPGVVSFSRFFYQANGGPS